MGESKLKYGIDFQGGLKERWSFGINFSYWKPEIYLFINLFRWTITIGKFYH